MGEIDTKPIEPVHVALSFFGEKGDERKHRPTSTDPEIEIEGLLKDVANYKLLLETKDSACMQAILKLEHYEKTVDELSALLKNSEVERDQYMEKCREARIQIDEHESKMKEMSDQLLETVRFREQLSHVLHELNIAQGELFSMETELAAARSLQLKAMTQAELMETAANMDREKVEDLLRHISELNEAILMSKLAAIEAEKEKCAVLSEKDAEIERATATVVQTEEELEDMRKQIELLLELENQLQAKSLFIDTLQLELKQANELLISSEKAASDVNNDLNQLKVDLEIKERKNLDQAVNIEALEMELNHIKVELKNANKEVGRLNCDVERLASELQKEKTEMDEIARREIEAQVEIALLKSELHKGRSKIAAAEAAEARVQSVKSGLYLAVQQLAVEAEEAKKENVRLKHEAESADKVVEESEIFVQVNPQVGNSSHHIILQPNEFKIEAEERGDENNAFLTISLEEYKTLIRKAEKANQIPESLTEDSNQLTISENKHEMENLKRELEFATVKIGEFRTRSEQALTRAEAAEKAKLAVEDQLRKWREQKEKRKAALAALREETAPKEFNPSSYGNIPKTYQPLGKVLNMKF